MVRVRVPASTSNLGSGFDAVGLALRLYLTVGMEVVAPGEASLRCSGEGAEEIQNGPENLVRAAAETLFERAGQPPPTLALEIENEIPLARGLGSSGAARIAGIFAANHLLKEPLESEQLLDLTVSLEGHPENASASLLGGLTLSCGPPEPLTRRVEVAAGLLAVVLVPEVRVPTAEARNAPPEKVAHSDAVFNLQRSALLSYAFVSGDYSVLKNAMRDRLHQPYREKLIPSYSDFEKAACDRGALGVCISGSGSSILALTLGEADAIAAGWREAATTRRVAARTLVLEISNGGAEVVSAD